MRTKRNTISTVGRITKKKRAGESWCGTMSTSCLLAALCRLGRENQAKTQQSFPVYQRDLVAGSEWFLRTKRRYVSAVFLLTAVRWTSRIALYLRQKLTFARCFLWSFFYQTFVGLVVFFAYLAVISARILKMIWELFHGLIIVSS